MRSVFGDRRWAQAGDFGNQSRQVRLGEADARSRKAVAFDIRRHVIMMRQGFDQSRDLWMGLRVVPANTRS